MDELVERVREALAAEYSGAADGRVRDVPDRRAVRWYTTIGLVDRPLGMRGRTALYGPRHLQQLVAIKRRQAVGRSLSQIQGELSWVSDEALAELSRVPERLLETDDLAPDNPADARHMRFWAQTPAQGRPPSFAAQPAPAQPVAAQPAPGQTAADGLASGETPFETTAAERTTSAWAATERAAPATTAFGTTTAGTTTAGTTTAGTTTARTTTARTTTARTTTARTTAFGTTAATSAASATTAAAATGSTTAANRAGTTTAFETTSSGAATSVSGVALRGGAILLVPNPVSDRDRDDIAEAAAPLLDLLEARGLIDRRSK